MGVPEAALKPESSGYVHGEPAGEKTCPASAADARSCVRQNTTGGKRAGLAFVAFTDKGLSLGRRLVECTGGSLDSGRDEGFSLSAWTGRQFEVREGLVFIGAAGIAVRAIAPYIKSKATDPAVVSLDEDGQFVIPLLSGHLGGANALARRLSALTGGTAVVSTATDRNSVFAVDLWAKKQGMAILRPERIKLVSGKLLDGGKVMLSCPWPIGGEIPQGITLLRNPADAANFGNTAIAAGAVNAANATMETDAACDVRVTVRPCREEALLLVPRVLCLGIGCKRGITAEAMEEAFQSFCQERAILPEAIARAASIDRKKDEAGLLAFTKAHSWPVRFLTADALSQVSGDFSASPFVRETVGVDNVCERAAAAGGGTVIEKKYARCGITFAVALEAPSLDWSL